MKIRQMKPSFDVNEKKALMKYMDSGGFLTEFKKTKELEQLLADFIGVKYCSMVCNGTVSLFTILKAYDIGNCDEVIIPDYTMIATATAVSLAGATPTLVDIEPETYCIDYGDFIAKVNRNTKAIMLVSINGRYPRNVLKIIEYCEDHNIIVIEDSAQALGSYYKRKHIGTFGDVASFSFSTPKIISMGQGGAIVTDNKELHDKIQMIKNFGRKESGIDNHEIMGWNFKFTDLQAVIGIEQMKKLRWRIKRKKQMYVNYQLGLHGIKDIRMVKTNLNDTCPWQMDILVKNRDKLVKHLEKNSIGTRPFHPAIHTQQPYYRVNGNFDNSTYISQHGLWLPSFISITDDEIEYVCKKVKEGVK